MKIAVVGSRNFTDKDFIYNRLSEKMIMPDTGGFTLISGGARGVDTIGETFAKEHLIPTIIFKPEWDKYGKSAGYIRNQLIIDEADEVIAFWDGFSKGTKHSMDLAMKAGKPLTIYVIKTYGKGYKKQPKGIIKRSEDEI